MTFSIYRIDAIEKAAALIAEHKKKHANGESPFDVDLNEDSVLTFEELKNRNGIKHPNKSHATSNSKRSLSAKPIYYDNNDFKYYVFSYNASVPAKASNS